MKLIILISFIIYSYCFVIPSWKDITSVNQDPVTDYGMHGQVYTQNKFWLFGGVPENRTLVSSSNFWEGFAGANNILRTFDPIELEWEIVNPCSISPPARSFFDMVVVPNKKKSFVLFGGQGENPTLEDSKDLGDIWEFNTREKEWTNLTTTAVGDIPSPRTGSAVVAASNGLIYIFGGTQNWGTFLDDLYSYNYSQNRFTKLALSGPHPGGRSIINIVNYQDYIYITNGCCDFQSESGGYYRDMWRYNILTDLWEEVSQSGQIYSSTYSADELFNNYWIFHGGDLGGCQVDLPLSQTSAFDLDTQIWYRDFLPGFQDGLINKNGKFSSARINEVRLFYLFGGYSSRRSDQGWCTQDDQEYKNISRIYIVNNPWFNIVKRM